MTGTLAIFTSQLGTASETFIRRHVEDFLPGQTIVVARNSGPPFGGFWKASCPVLYLDDHSRLWRARLARLAGTSESAARDAVTERFLRRHGVTAVLGEYLDQFADFVPLLDRLRLRYVAQGHGIDLSASLQKRATADRYGAYKSARAVLTRCEFHRRRLVELGISPQTVHVNPGGVQVPEAVPVRGANAGKRFLAIGRMVPKKGPIYLLEAFRLASARDAYVTLDVVGDGPLFAAAHQFVQACGLSTRVRLHGAASDEKKKQLLDECGVFVQHSITDPDTGDEEGLPAAIQEAMAHGIAVISTRHAGIPEAIEDGVTGWLIAEGDSVGMSDAMLQASTENELRFRLGAAARAKAERFYSWSGERDRLLQYLGEFSDNAV